jgi:hypothetical protein
MRHYELYSWSHQYRQERLAEAGRLHLEEQLREGREPSGQRKSLGSALRNTLSSLRASSESSGRAAGGPVK